MRTAAKAPVATCWVLAIAALDDDEDAAEADAELDADEPAAAEEDDAAVAEEEAAEDDDEPLEVPAAVALPVPHFSSLVQVAWPSASFG